MSENMHRENGKNSELNDISNKIIDSFPFKLHWIFGYNTSVPVINTSSSTLKGIFFVAGSMGVHYKWTENSQIIFSGHVNNISSVAVTKDKTYIATADFGKENSLIVWNAKFGDIAFFLSGYFPKEGIVWMCFSEDGNILLTLSGGIPQELSLWKWKLHEIAPYCSYTFKEDDQFQHFATFHSKEPSHFTSCSQKDVSFFKVDGDKIVSSVLSMDSLYDKFLVSPTIERGIQVKTFSESVVCVRRALAAQKKSTLIVLPEIPYQYFAAQMEATRGE